MNKYLKEIMGEMCRRVGADYKKMNFKKKNWYWDFQWSEDQEIDFKKWLMDYLKHNREARYYTMNIPSSNKKFLERFASEFAMNYGWRIKENHDKNKTT